MLRPSIEGQRIGYSDCVATKLKTIEYAQVYIVASMLEVCIGCLTLRLVA